MTVTTAEVAPTESCNSLIKHRGEHSRLKNEVASSFDHSRRVLRDPAAARVEKVNSYRCVGPGGHAGKF